MVRPATVYERATIGKGWLIIPVVTRACCRHDGRVLAGCIERIRGHDNYVGELGALLLAAEDSEAGGRVLLFFDATSPVGLGSVSVISTIGISWITMQIGCWTLWSICCKSVKW